MIGAPGLLVYSLLTWLLGDWLHLGGWRLWVFRCALWLLGLVAAALIFLHWKRHQAATPAGDTDLDDSLADARARLAAAPSADTAELGKLPLVLFLGPAGAAKTSSIVNSGLEPDLLAGAVFEGERITSTRGASLWYTQGTVLVDAGGALTADPAAWGGLIRSIRPQTLSAALTGRPQAPRAAVVCFSCEELTRPEAATAVPTAARELRARLVELAHDVGSQLPVYVLFTKADRLPFFAEFARNLSHQEARQALGATLRWPTQAPTGPSADRQFQRVNDAFQRLFHSLAAKRTELLARETDVQLKAAVYEFPREFSKITPLASQFLVELSKPSQLSMSPVLRGFYFSGVRAVIVSDAGSAAVHPAGPDVTPKRIAATQVFDPERHGAAAEEPPPTSPGTRRVPQWIFLERLFRDVILGDRLAREVTQGGARLNLWRRTGVAAAAAFSLLLGTCFTTSYVNNRRLERTAIAAVQNLGPVVSSGADLPARTSLQRLEALRAELQALGGWDRSRPPLKLRWGLYRGSAIYSRARRAWLDKFDALLMDQARQSMAGALRSLPDAPSGTEAYGQAYEMLKAYLMTTEHTDKIDSTFLAPRLADVWRRGREIDEERWDLVQRQFGLYSGGLCVDGAAPCASAIDARAFSGSQLFLREMTGADFVYQAMIAQASGANRSVQFSRAFPDASGAVRNTYVVPGAFTPDGWRAVQEILRDVDKLETEAWVLGEQAIAPLDRAELVRELQTRYQADYVRQWRAYLEATSVLRPGNVRDAARKLELLSSNQSPLLQLLALAAQNTDSSRVPEGVGSTFQAVHAVTPPEVTDRYVSEANQEYVNTLIDLHAIVDQAAGAPEAGGELAPEVGKASREVKAAVGRLAQNFRVGGEAVEAVAIAIGDRVKVILEAPTGGVEQMLGGLPRQLVNSRGREFCRRFQPLIGKYPFSPGASQVATLPEVAAVFQPGTGALWRFYDESLQDILVKEGPEYRAKMGADLRVTPAFARFFTRAAATSDALWQSGDQPGFDLTLRPALSAEIPSVTLTVDGIPRTWTQTRRAQQGIRWVGEEAREVRLLGRVRGRDEELLRYDGAWALFKLFHSAISWRTITSTTHDIEWRFADQNVTLRAQLNLGDIAPILQREFFEGLRCVATVVR